MNCLKIILGSLALLATALYNVGAHAQITEIEFEESIPDNTPEPAIVFEGNPVVQEVPDYSSNWLDGSTSLAGGNYRNNEMSRSERQLLFAQSNGLRLATTRADYNTMVQSGYFVRLQHPQLTIAARRPYVLESTANFVYRLADNFTAAGCSGLRVNDATRLVSERPANGSVYSVHPAGMALDLRVINLSERCYQVLTELLSQAEAAKQADVTREYRPPHFHVVVIPSTIKTRDDLVARYPQNELDGQSQ